MSNTLDSNQPNRESASRRVAGDEVPLRVEIIVDHDVEVATSRPQIARAVRAAASHRGFRSGEIGVRITSDANIRDKVRLAFYLMSVTPTYQVQK